MKPVDYRNETWEQVRERVTDLRGTVYNHLALAGPCTTRELARKSGLDILTVRPRMTELYQIGLVELVNDEDRGNEGIYQVVPWEVARVRFEQVKTEIIERQMSLL